MWTDEQLATLAEVAKKILQDIKTAEAAAAERAASANAAAQRAAAQQIAAIRAQQAQAQAGGSGFGVLAPTNSVINVTPAQGRVPVQSSISIRSEQLVILGIHDVLLIGMSALEIEGRMRRMTFHLLHWIAQKTPTGRSVATTATSRVQDVRRARADEISNGATRSNALPPGGGVLVANPEPGSQPSDWSPPSFTTGGE